MLESISAVTLLTRDMARSVAFYQAMGFVLKYGGPDAAFTSFHVGSSFLNLGRDRSEVTQANNPEQEAKWRGWGRAIFHVDDVDAHHAMAVAAGYTPEFAPRDASWGERYFHILDPDGHELSFARPLTNG